MDGIHDRLIACFTAVFPTLSADEAPKVTIDNTAEWDSSNHVLLIHVVEESFGIQIPEDVVAETISFTEFEEYLVRKAKAA